MEKSDSAGAASEDLGRPEKRRGTSALDGVGAARAVAGVRRPVSASHHDRILRTPAEVRNAVNYVRNNFKKHELKAGRAVHPFYIDPYSSMSGEASTYMLTYDLGVAVVATPRTWLLRRLAAWS